MLFHECINTVISMGRMKKKRLKIVAVRFLLFAGYAHCSIVEVLLDGRRGSVYKRFPGVSNSVSLQLPSLVTN